MPSAIERSATEHQTIDGPDRSRAGRKAPGRPRRTVLTGLVALGVLTVQPALAQHDPDLPTAIPQMEKIESGALVIPMDNTNQAVVAPFNLKAYGLVNRLLQNEIPVKWAISATKVKDGVDFSVTAARVKPTAAAAALKSFAGGPFIVQKEFATQALALATAFANNVAVFQTTQDVDVDVRYDLRFKPYVGIGNVNTSIHQKIMTAAGIPGTTTCGAHNATTCNWTMVDPLVVNSVACLTSHTDPHRDDKNGAAEPIREQIWQYLLSGGNFIAQCAAVRFFEGMTGTPGAGVFLTTKGITDDNVTTAVSYPAANTAFSQFVGALDYGQGGSWQDGNLGTGAFKNLGYIQVQNTGTNRFAAAAGKVRTGIGGNVFYLGGHDYNPPSKNLNETNGARMMLNTIFVPPQRPASCGFTFLDPGRVTIVKEATPENPWFDFNFQLQGPSPQVATLQDPGVNECPGHPLCADPENSPAWDHPDRRTYTNIEPTTSLSERYTWVETGLEEGEASAPVTLDDYDISWECKNAPAPATNALCDPDNAAFDFDACPTLTASCALDGGWADGLISGTGTQTLAFDMCAQGHVMCRFRNEGGPSTHVCLETQNAIGDLRVLGDVSPDRVSFTTAAVSTPGGDSADSIFLASFVPIADQSRWPGTVDHFIQPLPVVENDQGELIPDKSEDCDDSEDTACLAWDAAVEILAQAPDSTEVATDRRIGTAATDRRVTYSKVAWGATVPRSILPFDYGDGDLLANEKDLWDSMGLLYTEGDIDSENIAREEARAVIRTTLQKRAVTVTDPDTGDPGTLTFVAGDFFHAPPILLGGPSNFFYLANDLEGNGKACDDSVAPNRGYRCFFETQRRRRKVLLAPSNDGQLHAFDAGVFQGSVVSQKLVGEFDHGTGRELFAHIPRPMLQHTYDMISQDHDFGIDGSLVTDDVFIDPSHAGTPVANDRRWRSVVIGGYREGGRGLFALDLTQPDPVTPRNVVNFAGQADVEYVPVLGAAAVPECSALHGSLPSGCSGAYPAVLWEFEDDCTFEDLDTGTISIVPCDQDTNGYPDLAFSWSKVNTGRVLVVPAGETEPVVKFVAIFGGGLDPDLPGVVGNFLYMVDIETGKTLYKRPLTGSVPAEPAAVDTDQNGILDTVYVGTTAGLLYKVDIGQPGELGALTGQVDDTLEWAPFPIFDTEDRPIFFQPTVIFEGSSGHYAVGFGTGDREDLWSSAEDGGRFYLILDGGFVEGQTPIATGPLTAADFEEIPADADADAGSFLLAPVGDNLPGWVLELGPDERVVTDALAISGLLAFTTFDPERPDVCEFGGNGRIYTLLATNANALAGAGEDRARDVEGFAGEPVVTSEGFTTEDGGGDTIDPFETAELQGIRNSLTSLFPSDCRFGNFSLNVSSSLSSREMVPLVSIPVCIARKNWAEQ